MYICEKQRLGAGPNWCCGTLINAVKRERSLRCLGLLIWFQSNRGIWAITDPELEDVDNYLSEIKQFGAGNDGNIIS